ncbi:MAG: general secretion pathway protein GspK [Deltaproteobacteria bacterium]|nr:general secretion pathway protein GspK [Deltaproteobacteria bacterium]
MLTNKNQSRRGIALLFVMGALMIITVISIELTQRSQIAKQSVLGRRDAVKALELAKAAFRWSTFRLQLDTQLDGIPVIPGTNFGGKKDDFSEMQWNFPLTYPFPVSLTANQIDDLETEQVASAESLEGSFVTSIKDASAKINLNDVGIGGPPGQKVVSGAAKVLLYLLSSPRFQKYYQYDSNQKINEIVYSIDDWTDVDTQINHLGGGDEDQEYAIKDFPYTVKNGPFFTLSEVGMLKTLNDELFEELKPFVTVYPFDAKIPRVSSQPVVPKGKINVNTAPVELIAALISPRAMTSNRDRLTCAQKFAQARALQAFRSIKAGGTEPSFMTFMQDFCGAQNQDNTSSDNDFIEKQVMAILDVRSDLFEIEAVGISGNIEKTISAVVLRSKDGVKTLYWKVL